MGYVSFQEANMESENHTPSPPPQKKKLIFQT